MTAAYNTTMTDLKLNKKKQSTDPSFGKSRNTIHFFLSGLFFSMCVFSLVLYIDMTITTM